MSEVGDDGQSLRDLREMREEGAKERGWDGESVDDIL
jgi:hypothetical protein